MNRLTATGMLCVALLTSVVMALPTEESGAQPSGARGVAAPSADKPSLSAADFSVEVVGLRVSMPFDMKGLEEDEEMQFQPLNSNTGTALALVVRSKGRKKIVDFDDDASKLKSLMDNRGTDLTKAAVASDEGGMRWSHSGFGAFAHVSESGSLVMVDVTGDGIPAKGAAAIKATGTLVLDVGTETATAVASNVPMKAGKVEAGDMNMSIESVDFDAEYRDEQWKQHPGTSVTIQLQGDVVDKLASVELTAPDGSALEGRAESTFRSFNRMSIQFTYKGKIEAANIKVKYWKDMTKVEVPFDVTTGLGG